MHSCGSMLAGNGNTRLCPPLAQLKEEHGPLREQMDAFYKEALELEKLEEGDAWRERLESLNRKVKVFTSRLDPHSEREEGALFPMMAAHIGRETGPIAVMEYEHDQAKLHLRRFAEELGPDASQADSLEKAKRLSSYTRKAYEILTDHFMKEENILFPMAEKLLSDEEKDKLAGLIMA